MIWGYQHAGIFFFFLAVLLEPKTTLFVARSQVDMLNYYDESMQTVFSGIIPQTDKREYELVTAKSFDGRLYPSIPLHTEPTSPPKPAVRGKLYLLCAVLMPLAMWHLLNEANGDLDGELCVVLFVCSSWMAYGLSALYHCVMFSPRVEIFLQKADHSTLALLSSGTIIPLVLLLLEPQSPMMATSFFCLMATSCLWVMYSTFLRRSPSIFRQLLPVCLAIPFLPLFYTILNGLEMSCLCGFILCQIVAMYIKAAGRPNPCFSGSHIELTHLLIVVAGICAYTMNWSIVRRTCNPYSASPDLWESAKEQWQEGWQDGGWDWDGGEIMYPVASLNTAKHVATSGYTSPSLHGGYPIGVGTGSTNGKGMNVDLLTAQLQSTY